MTNEEIKDAVIGLVQGAADGLHDEPPDIKAECTFVDDVGLDMLDIHDLVLACEQEFDVELPDSVLLEDNATVADLIAEVVAAVRTKASTDA